MSNDFLNIEENQALDEASQKILDQSEVMRNDLKNLIDDMDNIPAALKGESGDRFTDASNALAGCFDELLLMCISEGTNLNLGQQYLNDAESEASEFFEQDVSNLNNLSRNVNG